MFFDASSNCKDIRVENDVLGWESDLVYQDVVGALTDLDLALDGVRLALLVECHHDHSRTVSVYGLGLINEGISAFFERDRVDDALALQALNPRLDHSET